MYLGTLADRFSFAEIVGANLVAGLLLVGFVVAATPFAILGITSAFWAILAGLAASALAERKQLLEFWAPGTDSR